VKAGVTGETFSRQLGWIVLMRETRRLPISNLGPRSSRRALVGLLLFSLVVSLATRTFHLKVSQTASVDSSTSQAVRQHLDRDAVKWVAPVVHYAVLDAPAFYPRVAPAGPPVRALLIEENLYNRPPPSC